jgi:starch synthase (maltosyl-transferring)
LKNATAPSAPVIFNLFPRYYASVDEWNAVIPHAADMGFNWIYVNPFHATGFSGSLYAIKNYYQLNPLFVKKGHDTSDWRPLKKFVAACNDASVGVMMDLVVNHTAFDSVLVKTNPGWYKRDEQGRLVSPHAIDPADAAKVTVWGDLAEIDNLESKDRKGLWEYWNKLVLHFQEMGIRGFRCDAAYQVPAALWKYLIGSAKKRYPRTMFLAETLGCTMEQIAALKGTGFDYLFNSSKYWDFDKPWCLEQHEGNRKIAPSISFPESHDTERLASAEPGTVAVQKMRYAFASMFSEGLLMVGGYEFGAKRKTDVVKGTPKDLEPPQWDLSAWIKEMNGRKRLTPVFCEEGTWTALTDYEKDFMFLLKQSNKKAGPVLVCVNKIMDRELVVEPQDLPEEYASCKTMIRPLSNPLKECALPRKLSLGPAAILFFTL